MEARHTTQADHSIWQQHLRLVQSVLAVAFLQHVGVLKNCVPATIIKRPRWLCSGQLTKVSTLPSKKPLLLAYCSISLFETRSTFTVRVAKPARGNFAEPAVVHLPSAVLAVFSVVRDDVHVLAYLAVARMLEETVAPQRTARGPQPSVKTPADKEAVLLDEQRWWQSF